MIIGRIEPRSGRARVQCGTWLPALQVRVRIDAIVDTGSERTTISFADLGLPPTAVVADDSTLVEGPGRTFVAGRAEAAILNFDDDSGRPQTAEADVVLLDGPPGYARLGLDVLRSMVLVYDPGFGVGLPRTACLTTGRVNREPGVTARYTDIVKGRNWELKEPIPEWLKQIPFDEIDAALGVDDLVEAARRSRVATANGRVADSLGVWDRYPDTWVAIESCRVVATASTWQELFAKMDQLGLDRGTAAFVFTDSRTRQNWR